MSQPNRQQVERGALFRALHEDDGLFVLGNAWDVASALLLEELGFPAIGTTSLGIAAAHGLPDGADQSAAYSLQAAQRIAAALRVPLSIDLERGSDPDLRSIDRSIQAVIATGAVGVNLEDGIDEPGRALESLERQTARIERARQAADETGVPFTINARTDVYWLKVAQGQHALDEALRRAHAYRRAGADCIFVPGAVDAEVVRTLVRELDAPLNVLLTPGLPAIATLKELGVRRLSLGSAPYRRAMAATRDAARALLEEGRNDELLAGIPYAEINALAQRTKPAL